VLEVSFESLTDVPVMAAWAAAFYFLFGETTWSALLAGLCTSLAILIRPNLVPLAVPLFAWFFLRATSFGRGVSVTSGRSRGVSGRFLCAIVFAFGVQPGIVSVAAINRSLYGSPLSSGYGSLTDAFGWAHVGPNLVRFFSWIVETQTPLALLGLAALAVPLRRVWPGVRDRAVFAVIGAFVAILWGQYSAYLVFDSAGYLRFLLPSWPFMAIGLGAVLIAIAALTGAPLRGAVAVAVVVLGLWHLHVARARDVFEQRQAARHEAPIGRIVRAHTEENSVILAVHRSGSLRYYSGRVTMRFDMLAPDWLDRAVAWFGERGVRVYAVVDERERQEARDRFSGQRTALGFDRPAVMYEPAGTGLYNLSGSPAASGSPLLIKEALPDLSGCDPPVTADRPRFGDPSSIGQVGRPQSARKPGLAGATRF
jgi:hypothetical protein